MADGNKNRDLDDVDSEYQSARTRVGTIVGVIITLCVASLLVYVVAKSFTGSRENVAKRMRLKQALAKFNADPTNEAWANEAATEYEAALRLADARQVRARHETAIQERDQKREQALLARIKENPKDGQALGQLLEFLVEHKRVDDARAAYLAFLNADPTPKKHAVYGTWLSHNGFTEEAVTELTLALKGYDTPETRGYLGLALLDLGKKREAFPLIERAFKSNADIAQLRERYYSLAKELGTPVPEPQAP